MESRSYNPLIRALESRILFDGAAISDAAQAATDADFQPAKDSNDVQATESEQVSEKELVFIDSALPDYNTLVDAAGDAEIHVINASEDGFNQIAEILQGRSGINAVHIIGHGAQGVMTLGSTTLGRDNLSHYSTQLDRIGQSLSSTGDLLLYGCNISEGDSGKAFVEEIAVVTKADVAASEDTTGSENLGGDWQLEYATGVIEAVSIVAENYTASLDIPVISELSDSTYTEQAPAYIVDSDISFSGGSNYDGGYIEFDLSAQDSSDSLTLATDNQASAVNGQLSIVGSTVYIGNGSVATVVGSVDSTYNGQNGEKLRVNFSNSFDNKNFSTGNAGDTIIAGWTAINQPVRFGVDTIAGWATPVDTVWPTNKPGGGYTDQNTPTTLGSYTTVLDSTQNDGEGYSVRMTSDGIVALHGYDIVRGPYIYSNSSVALTNGDTVSFEWQAQGGEDAYDVFGYILDVNTGYTETILNRTGDSTGSTTWATESITVQQAGNYRFVFVAGTYDFSGGTWAGAQLYIDDVIVTQQNPPETINDSHVTTIAQRLMYSNNSDAPPASKILTVTAQNSALAGANTVTSSATLNIVQVNDDPGATGLPVDITVTEDIASPVDLSAINITDDSAGEAITLTLSTTAGTLSASDANSVTVAGSGSDTLTLTGSVSDINTFIDNQNAVEYLRGGLHVNGDNAAVLTVTVNDEGNVGSGGGDDIVLGAINLNISAVNDAPVASGSATLPAIEEDTSNPTGDTVEDLFSSNFSDVLDAVNSGSSANTLAGAAIVSYTRDSAKGEWEYSTDDGGTWILLSAVTGDTGAFSLKAADKLRFSPAAHFNGSAPTLEVRLIDSSTTVNSAATIDTSSNGESSAYSGATVVLSHLINPVNDAPVAIGLPTDITVTEDVVSAVDLSSIVVSDIDAEANLITLRLAVSSGSLELSSTTDGVNIDGSGTDAITISGSVANINEILLESPSTLHYLGVLHAHGDNAAILTVTINDEGNIGSGGGNDIILDTINLDINPVNDMPQQQQEIASQSFLQGESVNFVIGADTFVDIENEPLTYRADGLPEGLNFDATTGTVSGNPKSGGLHTVTITAHDGELSAETNFDISVTPVVVNDPVISDAPGGSASNDIVNTEPKAPEINDFGLISGNEGKSELRGSEGSEGRIESGSTMRPAQLLSGNTEGGVYSETSMGSLFTNPLTNSNPGAPVNPATDQVVPDLVDTVGSSVNGDTGTTEPASASFASEQRPESFEEPSASDMGSRNSEAGNDSSFGNNEPITPDAVSRDANQDVAASTSITNKNPANSPEVTADNINMPQSLEQPGGDNAGVEGGGTNQNSIASVDSDTSIEADLSKESENTDVVVKNELSSEQSGKDVPETSINSAGKGKDTDITAEDAAIEAQSTEVNVDSNGQVSFTSQSTEGSIPTVRNIASIKMGQDGQALIDNKATDGGEPEFAVATLELIERQFTMKVKGTISDSSVVSYQAVMADGSPLPEWLEIDSSNGTITGKVPEGINTLDLKVIGKDSLGNIRELDVKLDMDGDKPDASFNSIDTEDGSSHFIPFSNQIANELENSEKYGVYLMNELKVES